MVNVLFSVTSTLFCVNDAFAGVCDKFKKSPEINLEKSDWDIIIKPSDEDLWPIGGFVNVRPFSSLTPNIGYVFNGKYYCVFLNNIDATVGFRDFEITIDKKYDKDSCEYNAVLDH